MNEQQKWAVFSEEWTAHSKRRKDGEEYCTVLVVNGYFPKNLFDGAKKWYWMMESEEVFCRIYRNPITKEIRGFYPCRLTHTQILIGRSLSPADCIII